jgi:signal transduction histidine kinase
MDTAQKHDQPFHPLKLGKAVSQTALMVLLSMSAFEVTKQLVNPEITIWQSHLATIIFSSTMAAIAAFFALRRHQKLQHQLFDEIVERTRQERQAAVLEERTRMARDLHDTLAQGFAGIVMQLEAAEDALREDPEAAQAHIFRARTLGRESLAEARRSVWELRPQALEQGDLATALARSITQLTAGTSVEAEFSLHGAPRALPPEVEEHLLRIGQEAVSNALIHAQAHSIQVTLTFDPQKVQLCVEDDGQGFDPLRVPGRSGFGLVSMRERAERLGGELTATSQPGQGTKLLVVVPVSTHGHQGSPNE